MSIQTAIDAYLRDARELLGTGATPGNSRRPRTDMRPAQPQSWIGSAADSAGATADRLDNDRESSVAPTTELPKPSTRQPASLATHTAE